MKKEDLYKNNPNIVDILENCEDLVKEAFNDHFLKRFVEMLSLNIKQPNGWIECGNKSFSHSRIDDGFFITDHSNGNWRSRHVPDKVVEKAFEFMLKNSKEIVLPDIK